MKCRRVGQNLSIGQFVIFSILGAMGTLVHYGILAISVELIALNPVTASVVGYVGGAVTNFLLAHHVAFRSQASVRATAPRFFLVAAIGFQINWLLMSLLVGRMEIQYLLAQFATTAAILCFNYVGHAIWTFGGRRRGL